MSFGEGPGNTFGGGGDPVRKHTGPNPSLVKKEPPPEAKKSPEEAGPIDIAAVIAALI